MVARVTSTRRISPSTFPTPPFPEYASGHSNFSAAGAEILRLATGSDRFAASITIRDLPRW
jgi:hypothetical protein